MTTAWEAATAVRRRDDGHYDVDLDLGWSIGGKPNGGYLLAMLGRAAADATGRAHPLAVSGHFLRPPEGGPAEIRAEVTKQGRTVSNARMSLWQGGRACLDVLVTTGELPVEPADYDGRPMPLLPAPDACADRDSQQGPVRVELLDHVDVRLDPATGMTPGTSAEPVVRGWMRLRDGAADVLTLLLAVDVSPPTVFRLGRPGWAPTVELTALLRAVPDPGWLAFEAQATLVAGGWFDEDAAVWDSTGRLVAQSRQLALTGRG